MTRTSERRRIALAAVLIVLGLGPGQAAAEALVPAVAPGDPPGHWDEPFDGEVPAIHMALRPDGTVAYYGGNIPHDSDSPFRGSYFNEALKHARSRVLDLADRGVHAPGNTPETDLVCSGIATRPDGSTIAVGGTTWVPFSESLRGPILGHNRAFTLGMGAGSGAPNWSQAPTMENRRWYPTPLTLPDGSTAVFSGIRNLTDSRSNVLEVEVLGPGAGNWSTIEPSLRLADGAELDHRTDRGSFTRGPANLPMYPHLFVVSGGPLEGQVFYASNGDLWQPMPRADEPLWGTYQSFDRSSGTWTVLGHSAFGARSLGATVPLMLDPAGPDGDPGTEGDDYAPTLLTFGGTLGRSVASTATAETVTVDTRRPVPTVVEPMAEPRWQPQGQLLPTGEVVAVGGTTADTTVLHGQKVPHAMEAEAFDPDTGSWETWAPMEVPRGYHSTSVLTPNATVLVGGHVPNPNPWPPLRNHNPTDETPIDEDDHTPLNQSHHPESRFEVLVPPYLERPGETRPRIAQAETPTQDPFDPGPHPDDLRLGYGDPFNVTVEDLEGGPADVVLVRPGGATHGLHTDQRGIRLPVEDVQTAGNGTTITLRAPPDPRVGPPGHYLLFVNEDLGGGERYPSRAAFVGLGLAGLPGGGP